MTTNFYGQMVLPVDSGRQFVACAVTRPPNRFVGIVTDDELLPIPADERETSFHGGEYWTTLPMLAVWYPHNGKCRTLNAAAVPLEFKRATVIGERLRLTSLRPLAERLISRDCEHPGNSDGRTLAASVATAVVTAAYFTKLIGGQSLRHNVIELIHEGGLDLDHWRYEEGSFADAWRAAWSTSTGRAHERIIYLTGRVLESLITQSATGQLALLSLVRR